MSPRAKACCTSMVGPLWTHSFKPQFWSIATCFQHLPVTFTTFALLCIRWMTTGTAFISFTMLQQKQREREREVGIIAIGIIWAIDRVDTWPPLFFVVLHCWKLKVEMRAQGRVGSGYTEKWGLLYVSKKVECVGILHIFFIYLLKGAKYG